MIFLLDLHNKTAQFANAELIDWLRFFTFCLIGLEPHTYRKNHEPCSLVEKNKLICDSSLQREIRGCNENPSANKGGGFGM